MINLIKHGNNETELELYRKDGKRLVVFFSYKTPVVLITDDGRFKTSQKYSNTTSKHINQYLDGRPAVEITQSEITDVIRAFI